MSYEEKARRNLAAAETLFASGYVDASASRFYCAMFQAALHLLVTRRNLTPAEVLGLQIDGRFVHRRVARAANRIRQRRRPDDDESLLHVMRRLRNEADYEPAGVDPRRIEERLPEVRSFVTEALR